MKVYTPALLGPGVPWSTPVGLRLMPGGSLAGGLGAGGGVPGGGGGGLSDKLGAGVPLALTWKSSGAPIVAFVAFVLVKTGAVVTGAVMVNVIVSVVVPRDVVTYTTRV